MYNPILLYVFGGITLFASFFVITSRNPVYAILSLIVVFLCATALVLLLQVDFLALLFLIVYVGAIAILFLFVVMMLDIKLSATNSELPIGGLLGGLFLSELLFALYTSFHSLSSHPQPLISLTDSFTFLEGFGQVLFLVYIPPFLLTGLILLVAMVGAIVLTAERRHESQLVFRQLSRQQRFFLLSS
jgi:NADH-quinone oxidoreductase subunit J